MLHGFQKKFDGFLSETVSDRTEKIRSGLTAQQKKSFAETMAVVNII
jgi:hypothetical protein